MDDRTYFAQLDGNNVVLDVHVVTAEFMADNPDRYPGVWVQTWCDRPDKNYAAAGMIYDHTDQNFYWPPADDNE